MVAGFEQELDREMDVPLATTAVELDSRNATVRGREAAIGNLIADAMRDTAGADAAVINGGGIRGGKVYAPGTAITRRDVLAELPFGNQRRDDRHQGRDLRTALENGLRAARRRGRLPAGVRHDDRIRRAAPGRRSHHSRSRSAARRSIQTRSTGSRPTTSWRAAATATTRSQATVAVTARRLAADGERGDGPSARSRQRAERRRGPHRRQIKTPPRIRAAALLIKSGPVSGRRAVPGPRRQQRRSGRSALVRSTAARRWCYPSRQSARWRRHRRRPWRSPRHRRNFR